MTDGRSASGSSSRAAARRASVFVRSWSQPISRIASASRSPKRSQADQLVVALAAQRPVLGRGGQRPVHPRDVVVEGRRGRRGSPGPGGPAPGRPGPLPRPPAPRRRGPAGPSRSAAPPSATGRPGARPPGCAPARGTPARPRGGPRCAPSAPTAGAAPRANSANTASPMSPAACERRSQRRTSSASNSARRTLWSSRSRSNRARGGQPGRIQRLDGGEVGLLLGDLVLDRVPAGVAQAVVLAVDPEVGGHDRVVREQAPDAGLDEVVEAVVERARVGRGRRSREILAAEQCGHGSSGAAGLGGAPVWVVRRLRRCRPRSPLGSGRSRAGPRRPRPPPCRCRRPSPRGA